ncbi:hypothetical protein COLO4_23943 [Corchorus olitorius]|uniref:Uncharacterized protein n=1 Tax=Corchorus olitorius TaxID=93759 RepID=A0A1R3IDX4_9ROSI|nr:hypothetical protein COLO4_23943 [Corchorus olitorius]
MVEKAVAGGALIGESSIKQTVLPAGIMGDNFAGILDRERAKFQPKDRVNTERGQGLRDQVGRNQLSNNKGDLVVIKDEGNGRHLNHLAVGQAHNKTGLDEGMGLQDENELNSGPKGLGISERIAPGDGGFSFQAKRNELDGEASSHSKSSVSRRKKIIPRKLGNRTSATSAEAVSLGKRFSQVAMEQVEGVSTSGDEQKLDRCVATELWNKRFPHANLAHLVSSVSDHDLILLNTAKKVSHHKKRKRRPGRKYFETAWCKEVNFEERMISACTNSTRAALPVKLKRVREDLRGHFVKKGREFRDKIEGLEKKLHTLMGDEDSDKEERKVAHSLAKLGLSLSEDIVWMEEIPASAMEAFIIDCNALP